MNMLQCLDPVVDIDRDVGSKLFLNDLSIKLGHAECIRHIRVTEAFHLYTWTAVVLKHRGNKHITDSDFVLETHPALLLSQIVQACTHCCDALVLVRQLWNIKPLLPTEPRRDVGTRCADPSESALDQSVE